MPVLSPGMHYDFGELRVCSGSPNNLVWPRLIPPNSLSSQKRWLRYCHLSPKPLCETGLYQAPTMGTKGTDMFLAARGVYMQ